jgi:hypothetical protein
VEQPAQAVSPASAGVIGGVVGAAIGAAAVATARQLSKPEQDQPKPENKE